MRPSKLSWRFHPVRQRSPATLHASLMARLDRLGRAKELAQIGAAIGREFSHPPAGCASRANRSRSCKQRSTVSFGLILLFPAGYAAARDLFFQACTDTGRSLQHAAARAETALHAEIAETLQSQRAEITENPPRAAGTSLGRGRADRESSGLCGKAGQRSAQRSALVGAAEQLRRALDLIATLPGTPALRQEEIKLQVALISPLLHVSGYTAPDTRLLLRRHVC